jgi:single-stranded-DNA-specific exonuclease
MGKSVWPARQPEWVAETIKAYRADPYSYSEARELAEQLGLSEPVAITLVRRGYRTPEQAVAFLEADESHDPGEFDSMPIVVARLRAAIEAGERVTVHGDFDVDGVCATAILVGTLRELGADCDWLIPDRLADGYGLSGGNVELLAERGTKLLVTVDCGVTAVEEVAHAQSLGIDVIVTDHHQRGDALPDCPILHPEIDGYPFKELCGTGVAWKLSCALRGAWGGGGPRGQPGGGRGGPPPPTPIPTPPAHFKRTSI